MLGFASAVGEMDGAQNGRTEGTYNHRAAGRLHFFAGNSMKRFDAAEERYGWMAQMGGVVVWVASRVERRAESQTAQPVRRQKSTADRGGRPHKLTTAPPASPSSRTKLALAAAKAKG